MGDEYEYEWDSRRPDVPRNTVLGSTFERCVLLRGNKKSEFRDDGPLKDEIYSGERPDILLPSYVGRQKFSPHMTFPRTPPDPNRPYANEENEYPRSGRLNHDSVFKTWYAPKSAGKVSGVFFLDGLLARSHEAGDNDFKEFCHAEGDFWDICSADPNNGSKASKQRCVELKLDKYIYVNTGVGHLAYAGRIGIMPEITVLNIS